MSSPSSTSSSRRALRRSVALTTALVLTLWGLLEVSGAPRTAFFGGRRLADKWERMEVLEREGPLEVLAVGASTIDQGFDARRFGEVSGTRAFNLGLSSTDFYFQSIVLRRLLLTGRRPKAVLWAPLDRLQWRTQIQHQYLQAPAAADTALAGTAARPFFELRRHMPQFFRRRLVDWVSDSEEPVDAYGRVLRSGTRPERSGRGSMPEQPEEQPDEQPDEQPEQQREDGAFDLRERDASLDYGLDASGVKAYVEETLRLLEEAGTRVWFVFPPYASTRFRRASTDARSLLIDAPEGTMEWLSALARRRGLVLLDLHFWAEISEDPANFYDDTHLNTLGSTRFGALLGELYAGLRPMPEACLGLPSEARVRAIFGPPPPRIVRLAPLESHALASAGILADDARRDLIVEFEIERAGPYRLALSEAAPRPHPGTYLVRFDDGPFRVWSAAHPRKSGAALEATLAAGPRRLEIHSASGEPIDWETLALVPGD